MSKETSKGGGVDKVDFANKLYKKYHFTQPLVYEMIKKGGYSQVEIAKAAGKQCDKHGVTYGSKPLTDLENPLTEAIGKATRPLDHKKNCWGINALTGADGTFSEANYEAKHGVKSMTLEQAKARNNDIDKYTELSKLHKYNTKDFAYTSEEYRQSKAIKNKVKTKVTKSPKAKTTKTRVTVPSPDEMTNAVEIVDKYIKGVQRQRGKSKSKSVQNQLRKGIGDVVVKQEHNKLQNKLYEQLLNSKGETDAVEMETNYIDVKVENDKQVTLYEVKLGRPIDCVRNGLGQLVSYLWCNFEDDTRKKKIVVVGPSAPNEEEKTFIDFIKKNLRVDFEYQQCS